MIHADFETRSCVDLTKTGAYVYAAHPTTDINCLGWAIDDGEVHLWMRGDPFPEELRRALADGHLIGAWNAQFERLIWNNVFVRYGAPKLPVERFTCIAALSRARGFPGKLEKAAQFAELNVGKDMDGHRLMMKLCRPRRIEDDGTIVWWDDPLEHERQGTYCIRDVEVERLMYDLLGGFSPEEQADFVISEEINDRGVCVDTELCHAAVSGAAQEKLTSDHVMAALTEGKITTCNQVARILTWVEEEWKHLPSLNKSDVYDALGEDDIPPHVADVLELRLDNAKAAVGKFAKILQHQLFGTVYGGYIFRGAGQTGRFSSMGVQKHNLQRKVNEKAIPVLKKHGIPGLRMMGDPVQILSEMVRPVFMAGDGKMFAVGDFAQIEVRVLAWLAGEEALMRDFHKGVSPYYTFGARAFGRPISKVDDESEYKVSKACIAEGELVLTDQGLVPIEQVKRWHRVWDGVSWVTHDGVVYQGARNVITYSGLTATPDHKVYLPDGTQCKFGRAAAEGFEIAIAGYGRGAVRVGADFIERGTDRAPPENLRAVRELQGAEVAGHVEPQPRDDRRLSVVFTAETDTEVVGPEGDSHEAAVHQPERPCLGVVRRSWHRVQVWVSAGSRVVGAAKSWVAQRLGAGPCGEQRALRGGQLAMGFAWSEPCKPELRPLRGFPHVQDGAPGSSVRGQHTTPAAVGGAQLQPDSGTLASTLGQAERKVWDILNAGPNHRFTVSGKLVSNCVLGLGFGGTHMALARSLKAEKIVLPEKERKEHVKTYNELYPKIKTFRKALDDAVMLAMCGPGNIQVAGKIAYMFDGEHLWCKLPSGRLMCYPYARLVDDEWGGSVEYKRGNRNPKSGVMEWPTVRLWGGMLAENVSQAIAFDLLMGALRRLRSWSVRLHTHDEVVTEVEEYEAEALLEEQLAIMCEGEDWSDGLPIAAEGHVSKRYNK